ncbi:hypothetical protein AB4K20DRAFT_1591249 [Rhizopus microsporus]
MLYTRTFIYTNAVKISNAVDYPLFFYLICIIFDSPYLDILFEARGYTFVSYIFLSLSLFFSLSLSFFSLSVRCFFHVYK